MAAPTSPAREEFAAESETRSRWRLRILIAVAGMGFLPAFPAEPDAPVRDLSRPIVFATSEVFFPYEFRDSDGQLKGFGNDIADAVARAMDLPVNRVVVANSVMADALRSGRIDVIQFWGETEERRRWADFSVPIVRFETVAVVRKGDQRIRRLRDLKGMRVAVGQVGTVGYRYLVEQQPDAHPMYTETSEDFLKLLSAGEVDAAVMSRLTAASMIERLRLTNLQVLDDRIKGDTYDVRYCFTVRKGDALLLARLNEGLAIIHRTGEFDAIYHRWFGRYERRTFTPLEVVSYVAAVLALACAAMMWGWFRQRALSRRVARQAAELAEQRSLLAALYEKHPMATIMLEVSPAGMATLISANAEAERVFRLDAALATPRNIAELKLPEELRNSLDDALSRWQCGSVAHTWEVKLHGGQILLEMGLVPLGRSDQGGHRVCVLANDVTQRRLLDHELAQSRRLRALGELVGGIAHEFNNLLTPILITTSQARVQHGLASGLQADFGIIDNAARRAAELTRRLLTFGRKSDERRHTVRLVDTVENCFALLRSTVDRRVEWELLAPSNLAPLLANPTDLNQIVFNLVINARDTLLEKLGKNPAPGWTPRLTVSIKEVPAEAHAAPQRVSLAAEAAAAPGGLAARVPEAWQRLTVQDNGLGIPPEIIDRIFEPFFTTKDIGQGTGLGLATVWHLTTDLGGEVTVESKPGEGTQFHVILPRWPKETEAPAGRRLAVHAGIPLRGLRILLAEDDPLVTRAALTVLERAAHRVTHCADGVDAWARLESGAAEYDVLLLDLNMPRLNGIDLIRRVRGGVFNGVVAVMSGRVTEPERQALAALDVTRIVYKPFGASELIEALRGVPPAKRLGVR